jgi:hypothetical protein
VAAFAAALVVVAGVAAACGDDDGDDSGGATSAADGDGTQLTLTSASDLDVDAGTVTLPLEEGRGPDGESVYYVVTDASDPDEAQSRGVNPAPKLANALGTDAVQEVSLDGDTVVFGSTPDFAPEISVTPGPDGFPPDAVTPGADGGEDYTPLITTDGETVLNATQVMNDSGTHDAVADIDTDAGTVTLGTLNGFANGQEVVYLRLDASADVVAALEESVYAPALAAAPQAGSDAETSALSPIIPVVNGVREADDPDQQGLQGAVLGGISPRNVQASVPGAPAYSPLWDVTPAVWTDQAVADDARTLLTSSAEVVDLVESGDLTSGGEGPANAELAGLRSAELISNCPTVAILAS